MTIFCAKTPNSTLIYYHYYPLLSSIIFSGIFCLYHGKYQGVEVLVFTLNTFQKSAIFTAIIIPKIHLRTKGEQVYGVFITAVHLLGYVLIYISKFTWRKPCVIFKQLMKIICTADSHYFTDFSVTEICFP